MDGITRATRWIGKMLLSDTATPLVAAKPLHKIHGKGVNHDTEVPRSQCQRSPTENLCRVPPVAWGAFPVGLGHSPR